MRDIIEEVILNIDDLNKDEEQEFHIDGCDVWLYLTRQPDNWEVAVECSGVYIKPIEFKSYEKAKEYYDKLLSKHNKLKAKD